MFSTLSSSVDLLCNWMDCFISVSCFPFGRRRSTALFAFYSEDDPFLWEGLLLSHIRGHGYMGSL